MKLSSRERILLHVRITNLCWEWDGSRDKSGYGYIRLGREKHGAHRASYEAFVGPIPDGLVIDHLCRNPCCVNPIHLEPVTPHENSLRGATAMKTSRVNGHEFSVENTRFTKTKYGVRRSCRACTRAASNRYNQRMRFA